jgi:hypothetical protein
MAGHTKQPQERGQIVREEDDLLEEIAGKRRNRTESEGLVSGVAS